MSTPAHTAEPLSHVTPDPVRWLWESYVPRGKLTLLDGDPGVGKSLVTIDLAARLSRGDALPDGSRCGRPHVALLMSGEDGAADTLRPRAEAAGADLDRVLTVSGGGGAAMRFPADLGTLESLVGERSADLVVIDPVTAFLPPHVASNTDQCVRGVLGALAGVAARTGCAVLLVRHLRKAGGPKAIHRGLGSVGIIGAARAGLLLATHPGDPDVRVLAVTKSNLARTPPALGLRLRGEGGRVGVEWAGPLDTTADALGLPAVTPLRPRDRAGDWLLTALAGGPRRTTDLLAAAAEAGIPERTLNRAKADLGVKAHRAYIGGRAADQQWFWYDPAAPWPADAPFEKPGRPGLGELPPLW